MYIWCVYVYEWAGVPQLPGVVGSKIERECVLSALAEQRYIRYLPIWSVCVDSGDGGAAGMRDKILNSDYSTGGIGTDMKYAKTNFRPSIHDLHNRKRRWTVRKRPTGRFTIAISWWFIILLFCIKVHIFLFIIFVAWGRRCDND